MNDINDGGPAFPCEFDLIGTNHAAATGMTLRDYFAAKAMRQPDVWFASLFSHKYAARIAYASADAMIKARSA